jgi:hypothetical protein
MSTDLKSLMWEASADLQPDPHLLADVRRGGRRRLRRRRVLTATASLIAALAVPTVALNFPARDTTVSSTASFAGPLADGRTHGDLAEDSAYLQKVKQVWEAWRSTGGQAPLYSDAITDVRVVWAGTTPAGPAALLVQTLDVPDGVGGVPSGRQEAIGYIGTSPEGPRVAAASFPVDGRIKQGWYVDPEHRVLAVVDADKPRGITLRWEYESDGTARREFTPLEFTDGVSTVVLPDGVERYTVHVSDLPFRDHHDLVDIGNVELAGEATPTGLRWIDPDRGMHLLLPVGDAEATVGPARSTDTAQKVASRVRDVLDVHTDNAGYTEFAPEWIIYGTTSSGSDLSVFERQLDTDPARLYALVGDRLSDLGPVDVTAALPVVVRLPDTKGWVVGRYGAGLAYRVGDGPWQQGGKDAALLPANATAVRVSPAGSAAVEVDLR